MSSGFWQAVGPWATALLIFALAFQSLRLFVARRAAAWRVARFKRQGERGESKARGFLEQRGYRIVAAQVPGSYELMVDDERARIHLRADFIVERCQKSYVAEVKSGAKSGQVSTAATRRQLLEYRLAFSVDGVLLVDMNRERIVRVEAPEVRATAIEVPQETTRWWGRLFLAVVAAVLVWGISRSDALRHAIRALDDSGEHLP